MFERLGRSNPFASTQPFRDELSEYEQDTSNPRVPPVSSNAWGPAGATNTDVYNIFPYNNIHGGYEASMLVGGRSWKRGRIVVGCGPRGSLTT